MCVLVGLALFCSHSQYSLPLCFSLDSFCYWVFNFIFRSSSRIFFLKSSVYFLIMFIVFKHVDYIYTSYFNLLGLLILSSLSFVTLLLLIDFSLDHNHSMFLSACLVIFVWMPGILNFMLNIGFYCVLLKSFGVCSALGLNYLKLIWFFFFWGFLFKFCYYRSKEAFCLTPAFLCH